MRQRGFSLTETLLAVGTLAIGLTFVAGTFLTGIYFSSVSTERTIAAVVAEEAFAKMQTFGIDPNSLIATAPLRFIPYEELAVIPPPIPNPDPNQQFRYPSALTLDAAERQYWWSAICRPGLVPRSDLIPCTVFVCRQTGASSTYWMRQSVPIWFQLGVSSRPCALPVRVRYDATVNAPDEVRIMDSSVTDGIDERAFIAEGSFLVADWAGEVYRVLQRYADRPDTARLDRPWTGGTWAWTVPPAVSGGRNPVIAVYQRTLMLPEKVLRPPGN